MLFSNGVQLKKSYPNGLENYKDFLPARKGTQPPADRYKNLNLTKE